MTFIFTILAAIFGVLLFLIILFNVMVTPYNKKYKGKYKSFIDGLYSYDRKLGDQTYFKKNSYRPENPEYDYSHREIIFWDNGDIKLEKNLYIHKSLLAFNLYGWYYWKKFQKAKEKIVQHHDDTWELRERAERLHYERYMQLYSGTTTKAPFKFLRG
jgi:hypothetical protein